MSKRPGKVKAISLLGAALTTLHIVYRAVEQDTVAMVQRLVIDIATLEPFHQVQYGLA